MLLLIGDSGHATTHTSYTFHALISTRIVVYRSDMHGKAPISYLLVSHQVLSHRTIWAGRYYHYFINISTDYIPRQVSIIIALQSWRLTNVALRASVIAGWQTTNPTFSGSALNSLWQFCMYIQGYISSNLLNASNIYNSKTSCKVGQNITFKVRQWKTTQW